MQLKLTSVMMSAAKLVLRVRLFGLCDMIATEGCRRAEELLSSWHHHRHGCQRWGFKCLVISCRFLYAPNCPQATQPERFGGGSSARRGIMRSGRARAGRKEVLTECCVMYPAQVPETVTVALLLALLIIMLTLRSALGLRPRLRVGCSAKQLHDLSMYPTPAWHLSCKYKQ
jgi:hypothetical protein